MADKIASFEEYKNKELARQDKNDDYPAEQIKKEEPARKPAPPVKEPVSQQTMEIEIEDPFKFLDEKEREEYIIERQKERRMERKKEALEGAKSESRADDPRKDSVSTAHERPESSAREKSASSAHERPAPASHEKPVEHREEVRKEEARKESEYQRKPRREDSESISQAEESHKKEESPEERLRRRHSERIREDFKREEPIETRYEEPEEEPYEEEEQEGGINMELVVRIASILTGIIILAFIGMLVKTKIYDPYMAPDPDEAAVVTVALPEGYTEKNDTVVVSGASSLNLRSVPSTESKETVVATVSEGTELTRVAVSDEGSWALVEYNGQQLYGAMKYLKEK